MKKIVILQDLPEYTSRVAQVAPHWEIVFTSDKEMAKKHLPQAEIIASWSPSLAPLVLGDNTPLKWVQSWVAGVDSFPMDDFKSRGIYLTTASGVQARSVTETFFATMLALARRLPTLLTAQKEKDWVGNSMFHPPMEEIHGKVLGVLGTGQIGQQVARIARAFSMPTLGYRRRSEPVPYFDTLYKEGQLLDMLSNCDYVVNLLPLTPHTQGLINKEAFGALRKGSLYFSLGRGETTVTQDLIDALESGHLGGAGLDVHDPEPLPQDSPLWGMDNVIITPHIGGSSVHYNSRVMDIFLDNLRYYVTWGVPRHNLVDYNLATKRKKPCMNHTRFFVIYLLLERWPALFLCGLKCFSECEDCGESLPTARLPQ